MGYGAIAGIPTVARAPRVKHQIPCVVHQMPRHTVIQIPADRRGVLNERTPLIRRPRARATQLNALLDWKIFGLLLILVSGVFIAIHLLMIEYYGWPVNFPFKLIDRDYWYQGEPIDSLNLTLLNNSQVSNVVLFHTRGDFCFDFNTCLFVIRAMQNISNLPFNFLIGGDGKTYEFRGWTYLSGFDHLPFNVQAITVGLIGDFTHIEPSPKQVLEFEAFIVESIRRQKLQSNFKLHGARLIERDGDKMFNRFKEFDKWVGWI